MKRLAPVISAAYLCGIFAGIKLNINAGFLLLSSVEAMLLAVTAVMNFKFMERPDNALFNRTFKLLAILSFLLMGISRTMLSDGIPQYAGNDKDVSAFKCKALVIREKAEEKLSGCFKEKESSAVICALILGDKSEITPQLKDSYRDAGVMHTLALSGLHVGIIWSFVTILLSAFSLNYKTKYAGALLSIAVIGAYCVITGLSPSVMRAGIMLSVWKMTEITFRNTDKWDTLSLSAMIICTADPSSLFMAGFQLSFAAVAGIAFIFPVISDSLKEMLGLQFKNGAKDDDEISKEEKRARALAERRRAKGGLMRAKRVVYRICSLAGISISCQIATLPISLCCFGNSSQYFLLGNIVAIPLVTAAIYTAAAAMIAQPLPFIGPLLSSAAQLIVSALNRIIGFIGS